MYSPTLIPNHKIILPLLLVYWNVRFRVVLSQKAMRYWLIDCRHLMCHLQLRVVAH